MKKTISICLACFLFFSLFSQEKMMSFDQKGSIYVFSRENNKQTGIFANYRDFQEARIYQISDSSFSLEIVTGSQMQLFRTRKMIDITEYNQIKSRTDAGLYNTSSESDDFNNDGRNKLIVANAIAGLGLYGWAVPLAADIQDTRIFVGMYMLTSGLSFYLPFALTSKTDISYAEAGAWLYGQSRGAIHGLCLPQIFDTISGHSTIAALAVIGSLTEAFSFYSLTHNYHLSSGQVHTIGTYADFGLIEGFMLAQCFGNFNNPLHRSTYASMLGGSALGYATGYFLSKNNRYTPGDAHLTYTAGLLGTYLAVAGNILDDNNNLKGVFGTMALGTALGLAGGHILSGYTDYTPAQGMLTGIGTAAGGLFGFGLGYLISEDNNKVWISSSAICAVAGFTAMNYIFRNAIKKKSAITPQLSIMPAWYQKAGGNGIGYAPSLSLSMKF